MSYNNSYVRRVRKRKKKRVHRGRPPQGTGSIVIDLPPITHYSSNFLPIGSTNINVSYTQRGFSCHY